MKQRTTPKRRLLALNLALVLLCSLILPVSAGAAGSNIVIGKGSGTVDHSGPGWVYDASERTLTLDNYQGGYIDVTTGGNLTIYANGNVVIDNESTYHSAIQLWSDDSLDLVVNGTLTINSKSANGIVANGDVTVRSNSLVWTGPDGKTYYDGKGSSLLTINAGRYGIRGNDVSMDVNGEVKGTSGAVRSNGSVRFGSQDGTSALNATLTAAQNAAAVVYNRNGTASVGEHMDSDFAYYGNTPYQLTLYPKTYTTTLNGDGGTCNGQGTVTVAQAYPTHVKLGDYAVTEAGFGADLGAEKFLDIKCRMAGLTPDAVVMVATVRALKHHGGVAKADLNTENLEALEKGLPNLLRHVENITKVYGLPCVVAINRFPTDTEAELKLVEDKCRALGVNVALSEVWGKGGEGGLALAEEVVRLCEQPNDFHFAYDAEASIEEKLNAIVTKVYHGDGVVLTPNARKQMAQLTDLGYGALPICMAKTQYSFSDDQKLLGAPDGFTVTVRNIKVSAGAGFLVALTGDIMTMPGLPKVPAAEKIDVDENGKITGLF